MGQPTNAVALPINDHGRVPSKIDLNYSGFKKYETVKSLPPRYAA